VITVLCIVYTALVVLLFKFKILTPRPYPIAWVAVAGVLLIGGVVVAWHQYAPLSARVVTTQYVVQLVSYVKGQVLKIHAQANQPLKKGDLLLEIDPAPFQYTVNQIAAQLQVAQATVKQSQAGVEAAKADVTQRYAAVSQAQAAVQVARAGVAQAQAGVKQGVAALDLAKADLGIVQSVRKQDAGAVSKQKVEQEQQNVKEKEAALIQAEAGVAKAQASQLQEEAALSQTKAAAQQAEAALRQSEFALLVATNNVPAVQAQLDEARFNLAQCRMTAPADGYVVDWQVQEGSMITTVRVSACGTFIVTSDTSIVASYPQNFLMHVQTGDEVDVVLDPYPGRLFKGKVDTVIEATGEGQYAPSGTIPEASKVGSQGLLAVKIRLVDEAPPANLPLGAGGAVAIYTDHGKPVHIISKVTIRMKKWLLYVMPA
jgi:multidrug resistance efflux pump